MTRSVADSVLAFNLTNGPHTSDPTTIRPKLTVETPKADVRGMRIALSYDLGFFNVADDVRRNTARAAQMLRDMGAVVEEIDLEWDVSTQSIFSNALGGFVSTVIRETIQGNEARTTDYILNFVEQYGNTTIADYASALDGAGKMHNALQAAVFRRSFDALLCPTMAQTNTPASGTADAMADVFRSAMTYPFNTLSRYPVLSVPSGFADNGVPTGVQIVGQTYCESTVFEIGAALEKAVGWLAWRPTV